MDDVLAYLKKAKPDRKIESVELFRSLDDFQIDQDHRLELYENPDPDEEISDFQLVQT